MWELKAHFCGERNPEPGFSCPKDWPVVSAVLKSRVRHVESKPSWTWKSDPTWSSCIWHSLTEPYESCLTSLCLRLLICKTGRIRAPTPRNYFENGPGLKSKLLSSLAVGPWKRNELTFWALILCSKAKIYITGLLIFLQLLKQAWCIVEAHKVLVIVSFKWDNS